MSDIVVGYDGSDCGGAALNTAIGLAKELGDRVVVAFGYEPSRLGGEVADYAKALKEHGERVASEAAERVRGAGLDVDVAVVDRHPTDALVALAGERDARMIVVGTHGDAPLKGAILGSTPHKLLHVSRVPVLVVPAR